MKDCRTKGFGIDGNGCVGETFSPIRSVSVGTAFSSIGKTGSPVKASAAGKVVYSGNGLRGYGELVIIKHNEEFLTEASVRS